MPAWPKMSGTPAGAMGMNPGGGPPAGGAGGMASSSATKLSRRQCVWIDAAKPRRTACVRAMRIIGPTRDDRFSNNSLNMADGEARYKVYEPIDDKNLFTPCCGADTPTCTFSASVANDQALSVARAELAVEQCASPFRYHIDHGTSLAQFGSAWKSLALGSAWPSVASTSKRLQTKGPCHLPTRCSFAKHAGCQQA